MESKTESIKLRVTKTEKDIYCSIIIQLKQQDALIKVFKERMEEEVKMEKSI